MEWLQHEADIAGMVASMTEGEPGVLD